MPETIGQQLKQARTTRYLKVGDVAQATHIQARFIEAMEADDFESLPSPVQARAFLRLYADFLGLSIDELIARQHPSTEKPPAENSLSEPVPGLSQASSEVPDSPYVFVTAGGPPTDNSLPLSKEEAKGNIPRKRKARSQSKKTPEPVESKAQIPPSQPEPPTNQEVGSTSEEGVKPVPDKQEDSSSIVGPEHPSQVIFTKIGMSLRTRREALSLTLDEIEQHTHVRKHYLEALEEGDFDHMPSSVQTRGMLNNYARFLDMDVDTILLQFAEGLQAQRLERQPELVEKAKILPDIPPSKKTEVLGWKRYLSMDVIIGVGLVLVLLVFAIWGTSRIIGLRSAITPQPTAESISDILAASTEPATPTPTSETSAGTGIPALSSTPFVTVPAAGQGPVQVVIVALEEAFVRVTVDGKQLFNGRVTAGTAYPFDGNNQIEVLTGNGAAISILFKQSDLGPMGTLGQVVDRIYTANAILNPTATATLTPTITPIHSLTPTLSPTSQSSSTPTAPAATQGE